MQRPEGQPSLKALTLNTAASSMGGSRGRWNQSGHNVPPNHQRPCSQCRAAPCRFGAKCSRVASATCRWCHCGVQLSAAGLAGVAAHRANDQNPGSRRQQQHFGQQQQQQAAGGAYPQASTIDGAFDGTRPNPYLSNNKPGTGKNEHFSNNQNNNVNNNQNNGSNGRRSGQNNRSRGRGRGRGRGKSSQ